MLAMPHISPESQNINDNPVSHDSQENPDILDLFENLKIFFLMFNSFDKLNVLDI